MEENKKSSTNDTITNDTIEIGCDGWRSWERLGNEILDWEGVVSRSGYAEANLDSKDDDDTYFKINICTSRKDSKQIFKRLKAYQGVIKARWGRSDGNFIYMGRYGNWRD